jgi:hypothetical protein
MSLPVVNDGANRTRTKLTALAGYLGVFVLLFETSVPLTYFTIMSLLILIGPGDGEPAKMAALGIHVVVALLYLVSFFGIGFAFVGLVRKSPIKWLSVMLSVLGITALPVALYTGLEDAHLVYLLIFLATWSVLLLVTTLVVFYCIGENKRIKRIGSVHWAEIEGLP